MNYIVVDLEWNQPADEQSAVTEPIYLAGEIIQIGAVKLNEKFETVDELSLIVVPTHYTKMHRAIASLTHIHDRDLKNGLSFGEAIARFRAWCGEEYAFLTWGPDDMTMLQDNLYVNGMDESWLPMCYDAQRIFGYFLMRDNRQWSLERAIEVLKLPSDRAHDALNDCRNTVRVCDHMDMEQYVADYLSIEGGCLRKDHLRSTYPDLDTALEDPEVNRFACPFCRNDVYIEDIVMQSSDRLLGYGVCDCCDFLVRYRVYENAPGKLSLARKLCAMDDDQWDRYQNLLDEAERIWFPSSQDD